MEIIKYRYSNSAATAHERGMALALGFFDGVHVGHRTLIAKTIRIAKEKGITPGIFTFPADARLKSDSGRLYSTEQKLEILSSLGVECVILCDFDSVKELSPEAFAKEILIKDFNCQVALSGYNFRFGKEAKGDPELLRKIFSSVGRQTLMLNEQKCHGMTLSTTEIREALSGGDAARAAEMLGAPYYIESKVERGLGIGHSFGFPTINTPLPHDCPLQRGVYKTAVPLNDKIYTGLTNVGTCPTFGERELHAETMLLDFSGDLYGESVKVYFLDKIRDERIFGSGEELKAQIDRDASVARATKTIIDRM